jgi:GrpB-like predicted nucleotidyltransferase (UPF0157 family)
MPDPEALGLARGTVVVRDYDPRWPTEFDAAKAELEAVTHHLVDRIEHVGSTAVPGLAAKPVIDIAVAVRGGVTFSDLRSRLEGAGYEYRGDLGDDGGLIFAKGSESHRTHYLHVVDAGSPQWRSYLIFREALRHDRSLRERYARLKKDLAARFPHDRESYVKGKHSFIRTTIAGHGGTNKDGY